jgi:hypothetical protein
VNTLGAISRDAITNFGSKDLFVTTTQLFDSNNDGVIAFGGNKLIDLSGGTDGPGDPGLPGSAKSTDLDEIEASAHRENDPLKIRRSDRAWMRRRVTSAMLWRQPHRERSRRAGSRVA